MSDISKSVIGSLISAVLIAVLFSLWNDYIYKKDQLTGYWKVESEIIESSHSKYRGMKVYYEFIISQKGHLLEGTGEKISEDSVNGIIKYDAAKRTHLDGVSTYRVFSRNTVDITYKENGRKRPSSTILNLVIESSDRMTGTFISSIASSKGKIIFTKVNGI